MGQHLFSIVEIAGKAGNGGIVICYNSGELFLYKLYSVPDMQSVVGKIILRSEKGKGFPGGGGNSEIKSDEVIEVPFRG